MDLSCWWCRDRAVTVRLVSSGDGVQAFPRPPPSNHGPEAGARTGAPTEKASVPSQLPAPGAEQRFTALEADVQGSNSLLLTKVKVLHVLTLLARSPED